jgi:hypothetical protein
MFKLRMHFFRNLPSGGFWRESALGACFDEKKYG